MRIAIVLIVLAAFAGGTTWLLGQVGGVTQIANPTVSHAPDYYLENATLTQLNDNGKTQSRLLAQLITHHPDDDSIDLSQPQFTWYGQNPADPTQRWHTVSHNGHIPSGAKRITLQGKVVATHPTQNGATLSVHTPKLIVYPDAQQARTKAPVTILRGQSRVNATGMLVDLKHSHMRLQADVRGVYVQ